MVKSLISIAVVTCLLVVGSLYEINHVNKQFNDFNQVLTVLYDKIEDQTATTDDVYAVQDNWLNKKKMLHVFIPHTEIKEVDLWLSETVRLVHDKEWTDALSKVEVLIELSEQIPKTFSLKIENVF